MDEQRPRGEGRIPEGMTIFSSGSGPDTAEFVYRADGTYIIQMNGRQIMGLQWDENQVDSALRAYRRIVS